MRNLGIYSAVAASIMLSATAFAENNDHKDLSRGYVTGSFETNTNVYQKDLKTLAMVPEGKFGSNNYLKLDYHNRKFSAGIQLEAYAPALVGFPDILDKSALTNYYVSWTDDDFAGTAGTFYEQFGSGLLFRSWEDRALGLNNAIMGARVAYQYKDVVSAKALWGMPRFGMSFSDTQIRGADASFAISNLVGWQRLYLAIEGSVLSRYAPITASELSLGLSPNTTGYSARVNVEADGFYLRGEYVDAGLRTFKNPDYLWDDDASEFIQKKSNAQLIETGYTGRGLGVSLSLRRLEWMNSYINAPEPGKTPVYGEVNMLNYVPALCTQYTYMLTTLHPYSAFLGQLEAEGYTNSGEMGGQLDLFYNFRRGTVLGGKRGMKVHANFSTYYNLASEGSFNPGKMLFTDLSLDVEKQFTKKFKGLFMWSMQEWNTSQGANATTYLSNIFVADMLYKFTSSFSTRLELQYLTTYEDQKDWMAALVEVNFAPSWSIYASDMYNHGSSKLHYYNAGFAYSKSRTRVAMSYGRYKAGKLCSGGVCRTIPAYTGFNLSVTTSF